MSRQAVRNFKLPIKVFNEVTTFEYYFYSPYTNKFAYLYSIGSNYLRLSKFQTTKHLGYLVECN